MNIKVLNCVQEECNGVKLEQARNYTYHDTVIGGTGKIYSEIPNKQLKDFQYSGRQDGRAIDVKLYIFKSGVSAYIAV